MISIMEQWESTGWLHDSDDDDDSIAKTRLAGSLLKC